jgi:hypothetical protein
LPQCFAENNPLLVHTGKEEIRVRPSSSIGESGEAMRNLTGTSSGDAYRRARVWAAHSKTRVAVSEAMSSSGFFLKKKPPRKRSRRAYYSGFALKRHFHTPRSSAIASKHAPEAVIFQRFPVPNSNPSSYIPAEDSPNPKQEILRFFTGEAVESYLTYSISIT